MALSSRELKNIGTAAGIVIFAGPLVLLYVSMSSWDADDAIKAKYEIDRKRRHSEAAERRRKAAEERARLAAEAKKKPPATVAEASKESGPVVVDLKRISRYKIEVVFTNVSEKTLVLAVPDVPGGLVRIVPRGRSPAPAIEPVYEAGRDDEMKELSAGATHRIELKRPAGFPRGEIRAVYDSRDDSVPAGAWRGIVESAPVK
jgi:hypothetical protein